MINEMVLEPFEIDYYTLKRYAEASQEHRLLVNERDRVIHELYEDISPTITSMDYDSGLLFTKSSHTESTALEIIDSKARYDAMIKKWEYKAEVFNQAMDELDPIEQQIVRKHYYGIDSNLKISVMDYNDVLRKAQIKLCESLELNKANTLKRLKESEKQALRERVMASKRTYPKREIIRIV